MTITFDNTRALGVGERVLPTDYYVYRTELEKDLGQRGELLQVEQPEVGKIVTEDETTDYRRALVGDPYEMMIAELGLETEIGRDAFRIACECVRLLDRKHVDYGPGNISSFGEFGVMVRLSDKIERLKNLSRMENPKNESVEDTYQDIANYAIIALMLRRKLWK